MSVNVDKIVVSDKFQHSDGGFKYFIGYQEGEIVEGEFWKRWQKHVFFD